jgi:hypothetical protein
MQLITEQNLDTVSTCIVEGVDGGKDYFIEGIFIQAEQKNRNGRIYPRKVLDEPVREYVETYVDAGRAVGELNHPEGPQINLDKVSHIIPELNWDGNDVYGKAKVLDTPMGKIVQELLKGGCQLGVSTRGLGAVEEQDGAMVVSEFQLKTVDIVQDPSAPSAFVNGIMEGVDFAPSGDIISPTDAKVRKQVRVAQDKAKLYLEKLSPTQMEEQSAAVFASFLRSIKF